jgi:hypothetical protein
MGSVGGSRFEVNYGHAAPPDGSNLIRETFCGVYLRLENRGVSSGQALVSWGWNRAAFLGGRAVHFVPPKAGLDTARGLP